MRYHRLLLVFLLTISAVDARSQSISDWIETNCVDCASQMSTKTGVYVLEKGEEALIGRAWLTQHAAKSIDVQYFIWSTDNIGILAAEQLLSAAERGVTIRVLVDDFLIDAHDRTLLLLSAHPNVQIRIYNPNKDPGNNFINDRIKTIDDIAPYYVWGLSTTIGNADNDIANTNEIIYANMNLDYIIVCDYGTGKIDMGDSFPYYNDLCDRVEVADVDDDTYNEII